MVEIVAVAGVLVVPGAYLPLTGGTMTGLLVLSADPIAGEGAATKTYVDNSVAGGITQTGGISAAGSDQAGATVISSNYNIVTTVAANTGVRLSGGGPQTVENAGANALKVYPPSGSTITLVSGALALNAAYTLQSGITVTFVKTGATDWYVAN